MKRIIAALLLIGTAGSVHAGVISGTSSDGAGKDLQSLFDGWVGEGYDVQNEYRTPAFWNIGASTSASALFIVEIAGNKAHNSIGIFDMNDTSKRLEIYGGVDSAGAKRTIDYNLSTNEFRVTDLDNLTQQKATFGSGNFGFYLDGPGGTFFSSPAMNDDAVQMVAFQGDGRQSNFLGQGNSPWLSNEWVLAWEDLAYAGSDQDFNDLVLIVESVTPVPEPGTLALLGMGLIGLGLVRRRRV